VGTTHSQLQAATIGLSLAVILLVAIPPALHSQVIVSIDTLTSGRSENHNPVVPHDLGAAYGAPPIVVFERLEDGQSQIASLTFDEAQATWRRTPTVLSSTDESHLQRRPDCSQFSYYKPDSSGQWSTVTASAAVWERFASGRWNIWYALQGDRNQGWTEARQLTDDTLGNSAPQVRALPAEERFLLTWRAGTALLGCEITPDGMLSLPETLGVSNFQDFSYHTHSTDYFTDPGPYDMVWTVQSSSGGLSAVYRFRHNAWGGGDLSEPDTLPSLSGLTMARVACAYGPGYVFLEQENPSGWPPGGDIYLTSTLSGWEWENVSSAPDVSNRNPSSYTSLVITKRSAGEAEPSTWLVNVLAFERTNRHIDPADSGIVVQWYGLADTIRGPGYDRHPTVGAIPFFHPTLRRMVIPLVWESDRSGRAHVYGTFLEIFIGSVEKDDPLPDGIALRPNYPNPFNPATTIEYFLPRRAEATLTIVNILGEVVATLAQGEQAAGLHQVRWDGSRSPSGIYFYRLSVGRVSRTARMVLMR